MTVKELIEELEEWESQMDYEVVLNVLRDPEEAKIDEIEWDHNNKKVILRSK